MITLFALDTQQQERKGLAKRQLCTAQVDVDNTETIETNLASTPFLVPLLPTGRRRLDTAKEDSVRPDLPPFGPPLLLVAAVDARRNFHPFSAGFLHFCRH